MSTLSSSALTTPEFHFQKRYDKLNWKSICNIDLEYITNTLDISQLQSIVHNITYSDVTLTDITTQPDINLLQLIRCTQLINEYLLNIQNYLLNQYNQSQQYNTELLHELDACKQIFTEKDLYINTLKNEIKSLKKLNIKYEKLSNNTIKHVNNQNKINTPPQQHIQHTGAVYSCTHCSAGFISDQYLQSHIQRRHSHTVNNKLHNDTTLQQPPTIANNTVDTNADSGKALHVSDIDNKLLRLQQQFDQQHNTTQKYLELHNQREQHRLQLLAQQFSNVGQMIDVTPAIQPSPAVPQQTPTTPTIQSNVPQLNDCMGHGQIVKEPQYIVPEPQPEHEFIPIDSLSAARQRLYDILSEHSQQKYVMFADMPFLKARFNHNTDELQCSVLQCNDAVQSMAQDTNSYQELLNVIESNEYTQQLHSITQLTNQLATQFYTASDDLVQQKSNYSLWCTMHQQHGDNIKLHAEQAVQQQFIDEQYAAQQLQQRNIQQQQAYTTQQQQLLNELQAKQHNAIKATSSPLYTQHINDTDRLLSNDSVYQHQSPAVHTGTSSAVSQSMSRTLELPVSNDTPIQQMYDDDQTHQHSTVSSIGTSLDTTLLSA